MKRVVIPLMGGLGNQLFQIAAGLEVQERTNAKVVFSDTLLKGKTNGRVTKRHFDSKPLLHPAEVKESTFGDKMALAWAIKTSADYLVREDLSLSGTGYEIKSNTRFMLGYFQNHKVVQQVSTELLARFTSVAQQMELQTAMKPQKIGLHLRFGDYLRNPVTRAFHGLTAFDYYLSALDHIAQLVDTDEVMLFSDEPERALDLFKKSQTKFRSVVVAPRTHSNLEDLLMLSSCAAVICSNSTFSWWAGWLGSSIREIPVVLPEPWFAEYRSEQEALYFPAAIRFHREIQ